MTLTAHFRSWAGEVMVTAIAGPDGVARCLVIAALKEYRRRGVLVRHRDLTLASLSNERRAINGAGGEIWTAKGITACHEPLEIFG